MWEGLVKDPSSLRNSLPPPLTLCQFMKKHYCPFICAGLEEFWPWASESENNVRAQVQTSLFLLAWFKEIWVESFVNASTLPSVPLWTFTSVLCLGTCKPDGKIQITKLNHKLGLLKDGFGFLGSVFISKLAYPMKINSTPKQYNLLELKIAKKKSIQLLEQKKNFMITDREMPVESRWWG